MRTAHVEVYLTKGKDDRLLEALMNDEPLEPRQLLFSKTLDIDSPEYQTVFDEYWTAITSAPSIPASQPKIYLDFIETVVDGSLVDSLEFCGCCGEMFIKMPWDRLRTYCNAECRKLAQKRRNEERKSYRRSK